VCIYVIERLCNRCNGTVSVVHPSVFLSVLSIKGSSDMPLSCCSFGTGGRLRSIAASNAYQLSIDICLSCGQRCVESRGMRLNTDLLFVVNTDIVNLVLNIYPLNSCLLLCLWADSKSRCFLYKYGLLSELIDEVMELLWSFSLLLKLLILFVVES